MRSGIGAVTTVVSVIGAACGGTIPSLTVVDLTIGHPTLATQLAVQVCAGLFNRYEMAAGPVYVLMGSDDSWWLQATEGIEHPEITPTTAFLTNCLRSGVAKGFIRYNVSLQQLILPNIITLAGVLDAVPLEDGHPNAANSTMVFDALTTFDNFSALDATSYMYDHYINLTSTMSKMNPGLDTNHPLHPPLTGSLNPGLIDFVVKDRLFNMFLNWGCIPFTKEHSLMEKIVQNNPWPKPIVVYGYDNTFVVEGGDFFEAETLCVKEHNMGQVASNGLNNMAFFSRKPRIKVPLIQNPEPKMQFNASETYLALVIGDGDNMQLIKTRRREWMMQRVERCTADPSSKTCFPLLWTISPHILHLAPDWAHWFFNQSYITRSDYFVLPPSGDLYSYPSLMKGSDQAAFIANTEQDCTLLNTSATVAWEWFGSWPNAMKNYFPRYSKNGILRSAFAVNVPFNFPVAAFWDLFRREHYKVLEGDFVLFRPREWRGTSGKASSTPFSKENMLTVKEMAAEINAYPKGTVSHIYLTSDGGANLDSYYDLVQALDEHVRIVTHSAAADMALQAAALQRRREEALVI